MGPQIIWLASSYGIVFSIVLVMLETGRPLLGGALAILFPLIRIYRRFGREGGYRLIGGAGVVSGSLSERGGVATRESSPFFFWACFVAETLTIAGFGLHVLFR
ncbi:MAG: hypothetical protein AB8G23_24025 [Myxococcota bacterium]